MKSSSPRNAFVGVFGMHLGAFWWACYQPERPLSVAIPACPPPIRSRDPTPMDIAMSMVSTERSCGWCGGLFFGSRREFRALFVCCDWLRAEPLWNPGGRILWRESLESSNPRKGPRSAWFCCHTAVTSGIRILKVTKRWEHLYSRGQSFARAFSRNVARFSMSIRYVFSVVFTRPITYRQAERSDRRVRHRAFYLTINYRLQSLTPLAF